MLSIHPSILEKLNYFHEIHKIPNIIFHGPSGSGKRTIVNEFIQKIYDGDKEKIKNMVMNVNCAHGKGIKFIREELKFFAKTHIISNGGDIFKSVILLNADKLTMDAQSALRRCIELFSHSTRFFIVIEDKYKLLKPILSRFCEIYVPELIINNTIINLHTRTNNANNANSTNVNTNTNAKMKNSVIMDISDQSISLQKELEKHKETIESYNNSSNIKQLHTFISKQNVQFSIKIYEKGFSGLDFIELIERNLFTTKNISTNGKKFEFLITFNKIRKEFRNEKILILFILHFMFLSSDHNLENISFM